MTTRTFFADLVREAINQRAAIGLTAVIVGGFTLLNIWMGGSL